MFAAACTGWASRWPDGLCRPDLLRRPGPRRSEEHTSELQSQSNLVCRLLLEKKKRKAALNPLDGAGRWDPPASLTTEPPAWLPRLARIQLAVAECGLPVLVQRPAHPTERQTRLTSARSICYTSMARCWRRSFTCAPASEYTKPNNTVTT